MLNIEEKSGLGEDVAQIRTGQPLKTLAVVQETTQKVAISSENQQERQTWSS